MDCFVWTALKFMECEEGWKSTALKTYLLERLRHLSLRQGEHKMQRTMLCTWLTELYLRGFTYLALESGTGERVLGRSCIFSVVLLNMRLAGWL